MHKIPNSALFQNRNWKPKRLSHWHPASFHGNKPLRTNSARHANIIYQIWMQSDSLCRKRREVFLPIDCSRSVFLKDIAVVVWKVAEWRSRSDSDSSHTWVPATKQQKLKAAEHKADQSNEKHHEWWTTQQKLKAQGELYKFAKLMLQCKKCSICRNFTKNPKKCNFCVSTAGFVL